MNKIVKISKQLEVTEEFIDDWAETFVDAHSYEGKEISEIKELLEQMLEEIGMKCLKS